MNSNEPTPLEIALENARDYTKSGKKYSAVCVLLDHVDSLGEEALNRSLDSLAIADALTEISDGGIYGPSLSLLKEHDFGKCRPLQNFTVAHYLRHVDIQPDEERAYAVDTIRRRIDLISALFNYAPANVNEDGEIPHSDYVELVMDIGQLYYDEAVSVSEFSTMRSLMLRAYAACVVVLAEGHSFRKDEARIMKANARHALAVWCVA